MSFFKDILGSIPIVGSFLDAGLGAIQNNQQNKANQKMVDRQNEYNSPVNQVARLRQAGLNPAMMYGSGSVANTQQQAPQVNKPAPTNFGSAMAQYFDAKLKQVQTENAQTQAQLMQAQIDKLKEDTKYVSQNIKGSAFDLSQRERLADTNFDYMKSKVTQTEQNNVALAIKNSYLKEKEKAILGDIYSRINTARETRNTMQLEQELKRLEIELRKQGTSFSDPILERTLTKMLKTIKSGWDDFSDPINHEIQKLIDKIF